MPRKLFGTDGVRGLANRYPMTPDMALKLGQAIAHYFVKEAGGGKILVGKDTRRSSYMLEYALCAGISSMGSMAMLTGPLPTPAIASLVKSYKANAGVMISASHNAYQDNGIKFFDHDGFKLDDAIELKMEEMVLSDSLKEVGPIGEGIGRAQRIDESADIYVRHLVNTVEGLNPLKGLKIVLDCANGAAYKVAPHILSELGASVIAHGVYPNGTNINEKCGATHPEAMSKLVLEHQAHVGIALDGDADRLILCNEKGEVVNGDRVLALCALERKKEGKLNYDTIVGTTMSNMGLEVFLKQNSIGLIRTDVGDRYIVNEMRKKNYTLGGEPSGHLIFLDLTTTGDGMLAALQVLSLMVKTGKSLSELSGSMPLFPQTIRNVVVKQKKDLEKIDSLSKELKKLEKNLNSDGRFVLRYSGTEPLLRLMVEAKTQKIVDSTLDELQALILPHL